ncbi:MAG: PPOX class F420-dependent oxidoreductase [Actinomycetota bacterium]
MTLADEKYVALTTYKKDGTPKSLPVWIAELDDGRLGFTTAVSSWKVKRLRNDDRVLLQPSNSRGVVKPGTDTTSGRGEVLSGPEVAAVEARIKKKYGIAYRVIGLINRISGKSSDGAIAITLD